MLKVSRYLSIRKYWSNLLLLSIVITFFGSNLYAQSSKDKLQRKKKNLEQEINATNNLLRETERNKNMTLNQLNLINNQIIKQQSLLQTISDDVERIEEEIGLCRNQIQFLKTQTIRLQKEYAHMIYFAYLTRNPLDRLIYIFSASSFSQAFQRLRYFSEYSDMRKRQSALIEQLQINAENKIQELDVMRKDKVEALTDQEQEKLTLDQQLAKKNEYVAKLKKEEKQLREKIRKKQAESAKLQAQIENLIKNEINASQQRANQPKPGTNQPVKPNTYVMSPQEKTVSASFVENRGKLSWPVIKGVITSHFGEHPHPDIPGVVIKNNGVDFTVPKGSRARVVFKGKVSGIITLPNGAKAIIVRHGDYLTVYSNLNAVTVSSGQELDGLQDIGVVATDPSTLETILHFEVWKEKVLENPEVWLAKSK